MEKTDKKPEMTLTFNGSSFTLESDNGLGVRLSVTEMVNVIAQAIKALPLGVLAKVNLTVAATITKKLG